MVLEQKPDKYHALIPSTPSLYLLPPLIRGGLGRQISFSIVPTLCVTNKINYLLMTRRGASVAAYSRRAWAR